MIQRIQSLYLLIATAAYVCLFFFPFAGFGVKGKIYTLSVLGVLEDGALYQRAVPLLAGVILLVFLTFAVIFLYKKRMVQSRLVAVVLLLNVALIAGMFFFSDSVAKDLGSSADFKAGAYIMLIPVVFLVLANRAIRKDEIRARSADRLR